MGAGTADEDWVTSEVLPSAFSPAIAGAAEVVGLVRRLADGQGRDDLVDQLDAIRRQLLVEPVPVVVLGGPGQGKSAVVDALVGAAISPTGDHGTTAVPLRIAHAEAYGAELVVDRTATGQPPETREVPFAEAVGLATHALNPGNQWGLREIHVGVPSPTLGRGLVLVDTPAVREVWSPATARLLRVVAGASAVVLVTSAAAELTPGELDLLRAAAALCHRVIVVVNGTNAFPGAASVIERDQLLLEQRGVPARVFGVAATPYWGEAGGVPPGPDRGMQQLAAHLAEGVVLDVEHQRISRSLVEAFWAADRLRMRLYAERALLGDGDGIDAATARLRRAAQQAQELCSPTAEWHRALTTGLDQLRRDVDDDLGAELGRLTTDLDARLATEPWTAVQHWLHGRLADTVVHVHRVRKLAIRGYCKQVADRFLHDWTEIVTALDIASEAHALLNPRLDRPSLTGTATFADLPPAPEPPPPPDPATVTDPATAGALARRWLAVTEAFLRADSDELLGRVADELADRCQGRAVELHRSIVEVLTTLSVLRNLEPAMVLQRHEALASDLEQLAGLDFQLQRDEPRPRLGY